MRPDRKVICVISLLIMGTTTLAFAHGGGHHDAHELNPWLVWVGHFHPVLVHYPIALTLMAGIAELLNLWRKDTLWHRDTFFDNAASFLIVAAALFSVPAVITGYIFSLPMEEASPLLWWHRLFGIVAMVAVLSAACLKFSTSRLLYGIVLLAAVLLITVTAYLGGAMTWGIGHLLPPVM